MSDLVPGTVQSWDDEEGWGVLATAVTPGGCWAHFSAVELDGYRSLTPGQAVHVAPEAAHQDGYRWRAVRVTVDGAPPWSGPPAHDTSGDSRSTLTVTWDDEPG